MAMEIEAAVRTKALRRRFMLLDGMVLVAATAVGYAVVHAFATQVLQEDLLSLLRGVVEDGRPGSLAAILMVCTVPVLAAWTLALIPLRLLKPRPRFRRLARQPGLVAAISFATAIAFLATLLLTIRILLGEGEWWNSLGMIFMILPTAPGVAVLVSWATLIVSGRWQAEPSWIDRLGRVFGVLWIVQALASPLVLLLFSGRREPGQGSRGPGSPVGQGLPCRDRSIGRTSPALYFG
jgi:hypothetical protein